MKNSIVFCVAGTAIGGLLAFYGAKHGHPLFGLSWGVLVAFAMGWFSFGLLNIREDAEEADWFPYGEPMYRTLLTRAVMAAGILLAMTLTFACTTTGLTLFCDLMGETWLHQHNSLKDMAPYLVIMGFVEMLLFFGTLSMALSVPVRARVALLCGLAVLFGGLSPLFSPDWLHGWQAGLGLIAMGTGLYLMDRFGLNVSEPARQPRGPIKASYPPPLSRRAGA